MKRIGKILIIFCIVILAVGMTACSDSSSENDNYDSSSSYDYDMDDDYDYDYDDDYDYSSDYGDTNSNLELVGDTKGTVEYDWLTIKGKVRNNSSENYSYVEINFSVYDSEGSKIGTCMDNISGLSAGETWSFEALGQGNINCTYQLDSIEGF